MGEEVGAQTLDAEREKGMDNDRRLKLLRHAPKRVKQGIIEILAVHVSSDSHARQAAFLHREFEFFSRPLPGLKRDGGDSRETALRLLLLQLLRHTAVEQPAPAAALFHRQVVTDDIEPGR